MAQSSASPSHTVMRLKKGVFNALLRVLPGAWRRLFLDFYRFRRGERKERRRQAALPAWSRQQGAASGAAVRVGFVGAGVYAQHHLRVLADLEGVELAALLTTGGHRAQEAAATYGIARLYDEREAFLKDPAIDCFVVVVPSYSIREVAGACLATGKPVLMEKPAGYSAAESEELAAIARRHNTFGMVCMNRRFYSPLEHGLALLADYGPLRGAVLEIPEAITDDRQKGRLADIEYEHFMFRNSVHGIDLLRYVLGDVLHVQSVSRPNSAYRYAGASFAGVIEHDTGALSTVLALWDSVRVWRLRIIAERASLELEQFERGWFIYPNGVRVPLPVDEVDTAYRMGVYAQDLHFIRAVRDRQPPPFPACLLDDAAATNRLIEQLYGVAGISSPPQPPSGTPSPPQGQHARNRS